MTACRTWVCYLLGSEFVLCRVLRVQCLLGCFCWAHSVQCLGLLSAEFVVSSHSFFRAEFRVGVLFCAKFIVRRN